MSNEYISPNQYKIDILHYDLEIDLFPEKKFLKGAVQITGVIKEQGMEIIDLNFYDNLKIKELSLNNKIAEYENKETRLTVFIDGEIQDIFLLQVEYEGTPKRAGLSAFVFGEIDGQSLVYNLNEPSYASAWFPCNDIPLIKHFSISELQMIHLKHQYQTEYLLAKN